MLGHCSDMSAIGKPMALLVRGYLLLTIYFVYFKLKYWTFLFLHAIQLRRRQDQTEHHRNKT